MSSFDLIVTNARKRLDYLHGYRDVASIIKKRVMSYFVGARVLVFGSVIDGNITANSDIDLLIIIDEIMLKRQSLEQRSLEACLMFL